MRDELESLRQEHTRKSPRVRSKAATQKIQSSTELSQNQLAQRLGCSIRRLIDRRGDAVTLAQWTQRRDPQGRGWEFRDGKYYPIE